MSPDRELITSGALENIGGEMPEDPESPQLARIVPCAMKHTNDNNFVVLEQVKNQIVTNWEESKTRGKIFTERP